MRFDFDVAIVGGGPAGTSTALHLVRRERIAPASIVLLEKATHPRDKPCAGAVSAWGLDALSAIGVPLGVPSVVMQGLRVLAGDAVGEHRGSLGAVIRRCEFDAALWHRAAGDGVVARDGEAVTDLAPIAGGWRLTTPRGTLRARLVAACDGAGSKVRKLLSWREPLRRGHLYVAETRPTRHDAAMREGLCDFDLRVADDGIEGYYWDFPIILDGAPAISRGIYHANFTPRADVKAQFARALGRRGVDIAEIRCKPFSTRPFPATGPLALGRLILVGEAAGIDATTGEGIAQAILTGALAAKHLAVALRSGDGTLRDYGIDLRRSRVGRHMLQSAWLARRVYGSRGRAWRSLLAQDALAREAGARWYAGEHLPWSTKARLAVALGARVVRDAAG